MTSKIDIGPVLITGSSGFVGRHAMELLAGRPVHDAHGEIDLRDAARLCGFFQDAPPPSAVLHLAALAFVPDSFRSERATYDVNFLGTLNLLEALRDTGFHGKFIYVSSADAYGVVPDTALPISEQQPLAPRSPYAASKAAGEALCASWSTQAAFTIIRARPFNHVGPGQDPRFVVSDFAKQLVEIAAGVRSPQITTGDLSSSRDFTDVRDVVNAYRLLFAHGKNGDIYNICSGKEILIQHVLERLIALSGVRAVIERDPLRDRVSEQHRSVGSFQKLNQDTGWAPRIDIDQSLTDVLAYWKERLHG